MNLLKRWHELIQKYENLKKSNALSENEKWVVNEVVKALKVESDSLTQTAQRCKEKAQDSMSQGDTAMYLQNHSVAHILLSIN